MLHIKKMKIDIIVQARLNSKRFPRKILADLGGKSVLMRVLDIVDHVEARHEQVIAVPRPDCIEIEKSIFRARVHKHPWALVVGCEDENDVAIRFAQVVNDAFVRICADSPLIDPKLIEHAIDMFKRNQPCDYLTTKNLPHGQQVQIFNTRTFIHEYPRMDAKEREHVGLYFDRRRDTFKHWTFGFPNDMSRYNFCVDYPKDLERLNKLVAAMDRPSWSYTWQELVSLSERLSLV